MRTIFVCFSAALLTLGLGCSKNPVIEIKGGVIMPLNSGMHWYGTQRSFTDKDDNISRSIIIYSLGESVTFDNETWFEFIKIYDTDTSRLDMLVTNRDDGLWIWYTHIDSLSGEPDLWAKYPATVGDTFSTRTHPMEKITVENTNSIVWAPSGIFRSYNYRVNALDIGNAPILNRYFSPNVGLVKTEYFDYFIFPQTTYVWELDSLVQR